MSSLLRASSLLLLAGCMTSGDCPPYDAPDPAGGTYRSARLQPGDGGFPHAGVEAKNMVVDHEAGVVRFRYVRDGRT